MTGMPYRHLQVMLIETPGDGIRPVTQPYTKGFRYWISNETAACLPSQAAESAPVRLAVDSTGLKQHNRGVDQTQVEDRRGFVKLHVMADVDTKKILAVQVTDDRAEDSPMLVPLLDGVLKAVTRTCQAQDSDAGPADAGCCLYGDAACASKDNVLHAGIAVWTYASSSR